MAFSDMNDVEQELGEEKPPDRNGNRTFLIIAGTLAGIMVLALLCIGGLALFRYLPNQRAAQNAEATNAAQVTANALAATQTASVPTSTATSRPTSTPTKTLQPTNTQVVVLAPTKSPTLDIAIATRNALLTQIAATHAVSTQTTATPFAATSTTASLPTATSPRATLTIAKSPTPATPRPTTTGLPVTGIADELGTPGLITAAFVLIVIIFLVRRLRTSS